VSGCGACRAELAELAVVADALLLAAPLAEPPAGFENRVLARFGTERPARVRLLSRAWVRPALIAVAAAAVVVVLVGGFVLRGDVGGREGVVAARLLGADGRAVGQVLVSDHPNRMVCVLDGARAGALYAVSVRGHDGAADVGTFVSDGPGYPWATSLPMDGSDVRRVVIRDRNGTVRATATLPG
jgi:predicted anti-sigma-YlaC factor YlaD